jgi:hypothetical protein
MTNFVVKSAFLVLAPWLRHSRAGRLVVKA